MLVCNLAQVETAINDGDQVKLFLASSIHTKPWARQSYAGYLFTHFSTWNIAKRQPKKIIISWLVQ